MVDAGTGIGSEACIDVFKYAQAQKDERSETTEEIETKYGTNYHGCAMCGVIDPNKITQLK